ncbi:DNA repair protein RAD50-like [Xenia sp. Carnegie-2017]|uniref:DNA repair protein RAD50-like n=1 Tax=Xenia sp. Carnegie-2017 TaxID=2897299 RepID=UPI001F04F891|nr:DNA repair protein RAD50-like [Xenia sp. Carnegie-2017]
MHTTLRFPAVTICNINPVRRSRWEKRQTKSESVSPNLTSFMQVPQKLYRSAGGTNFGNSLKRKKRSLANQDQIDKLRQELNERIDTLEKTLSKHINDTSLQKKEAGFELSESEEFVAHVNRSNTTNKEMEKRLNDFEKRLKITELTTIDITKQISETRGYLNQLKANISQAEKEPKKNNTAGDMQKDGIKITTKQRFTGVSKLSQGYR